MLADLEIATPVASSADDGQEVAIAKRRKGGWHHNKPQTFDANPTEDSSLEGLEQIRMSQGLPEKTKSTRRRGAVFFEKYDTLRSSAAHSQEPGPCMVEEELAPWLVARKLSALVKHACQVEGYHYVTDLTSLTDRELEKLGERAKLLPGEMVRLQRVVANGENRRQDVVVGMTSVIHNMDDIVKTAEAGCHLSQSFCWMLVSACVLASVGLVGEDQVVLLASMLVSPLMNPVLATSMGFVLARSDLIKAGIFTTLCALGISIIVGFISGIALAPYLCLLTDEAFEAINSDSISFTHAMVMKGNHTICMEEFGWHSVDEKAQFTWPSPSMMSRMYGRLHIAFIVALFSAIALGMALLSKNMNSVVGVAISVSLLPPAVNCGMLWAIHIITPADPRIEIMRHQSLTGGGISLAITLVNIGTFLVFIPIVFWAACLVYSRRLRKQGGVPQVESSTGAEARMSVAVIAYRNKQLEQRNTLTSAQAALRQTTPAISSPTMMFKTNTTSQWRGTTGTLRAAHI
jgi:uncharacterized membrane protein